MKEWRLQFPIEVMSRVFEVSRSGYYDWLNRKPTARAQENERLKIALRVAHKRCREVYGTRRLQPELVADGFIAGRDRIGRLRKELGLSCKQRRKIKATTNSNHTLPVAPNLLEQKFAASQPNQVWVTDITYVPTAEASVREYIEIFYNRQRRHSRLGYVAPAVFADNFITQQTGA